MPREQRREGERKGRVEGSEKPAKKLCPCCGRQVEPGTVEFNTVLRANDVQKVFSISPERVFSWNPDIAPQEGAQAFAEALNLLLASPGQGPEGRGGRQA